MCARPALPGAVRLQRRRRGVPMSVSVFDLTNCSCSGCSRPAPQLRTGAPAWCRHHHRDELTVDCNGCASAVCRSDRRSVCVSDAEVIIHALFPVSRLLRQVRAGWQEAHGANPPRRHAAHGAQPSVATDGGRMPIWGLEAACEEFQLRARRVVLAAQHCTPCGVSAHAPLDLAHDDGHSAAAADPRHHPALNLPIMP